MGVDGVTTTAVPTAAVARKPLEPAEQPQDEAPPLGARRTSIPPGYSYGASRSSDVTTPTADVAERRWRSFDCAGSAKAEKLGELEARIAQEHAQARRCSERLRPRKRSALLRSIQALFSSEKKKEQLRLRQMQMVAEAATRARSLVVLNDLRTLVLTTDDDMDDDMDDSDERRPPQTPTPTRGDAARSSFATTIDSSVQRLLDGLSDADQVLADDSLHRILELQTHWLQLAFDMHADKKYDVPRSLGVSGAVALQQFLSEFARPDGRHRVPCALDAPTPALIRFEKLVTRFHLLKPHVKRSLDRLCRDTMSSFVRRDGVTPEASITEHVWGSREPRDVMQSLVHEIEDAIVEEAHVPDTTRSILHVFVEQMIYSRLAGACYRSVAAELDEQNARWREDIAASRNLAIDDVGLPVDIPEALREQLAPAFAKSIDAFNRIPHLVPSCVLAAFISAIRVLYAEADELLGLSCACISADVLLPLLVHVLSHCDLPHLHSQIYLLEHFAIETSTEGSEAAYYVACLQAAVGYIMMGPERPSE
ncbi:hypothetical protein ATCC90586_008125 [Pythium insidiosum]|nr:hypothetical protein ATCC90586_008125 [Pythium insidiosum]